MSIFGDIWEGATSMYTSVKDTVAPIVSNIPIIGPPLIAGYDAFESVLAGGGATVTDEAGQKNKYGADIKPGFLAGLKSASIMGVPLIFVAIGGVAAVMLFGKKGGR